MPLDFDAMSAAVRAAVQHGADCIEKHRDLFGTYCQFDVASSPD